MLGCLERIIRDLSCFVVKCLHEQGSLDAEITGINLSECQRETHESLHLQQLSQVLLSRPKLLQLPIISRNGLLCLIIREYTVNSMKHVLCIAF